MLMLVRNSATACKLFAPTPHPRTLIFVSGFIAFRVFA
jgi:hypothetical protein